MSSSVKIVLGILILGGVAWAVWNYSNTTSPVDTQKPAGPTLTTGSTNADLDTDIATIDSELDLISNSSVEIDQSMNDTPTQ